jgi:hypothetical protein
MGEALAAPVAVANNNTESRREAAQRFLAGFMPIAPWAIATLGIVLRLLQYLHDRSLFLDEAFVATSIAQKSALELIKPLLYDQRAPVGFLLPVKAAYVALGGSDLALRLVSLLAGCCAMAIFFAVARCYVRRGAALLAAAFFALSEAQIFYSSDLKPYSLDTLVALVLLWAFAALEDRPLNFARAVGLALLGAAAIWCSFSALFVLGGSAAWFGIRALIAGRRTQIAWLMGTGLAWTVSLAALYWLQLRHFEANPGWKDCWRPDFLPHSFRLFGWLLDRFQYLTSTEVGLAYPGLALLAALLGVRTLAKQNRYRCGLLLAPLVVAVFVAAAHIYPLGGRVALYLAPPSLLLIAAGVDCLFRLRVETARWLAIGMAALLLLQPLGVASRGLRGKILSNPMFWGYRLEEVKPVMKHIREHWQPGDIVYLYSQSDVAFRYYAGRYGFQPQDGVKGIEAGLMNPQWWEVRQDLEKFRGRRRVWFLFTHVWTANGVDEQKLWLYFLDQMGRRLDEIVMPPETCNAAGFLYDLSAPPKSPSGEPEKPSDVNPQAPSSARPS